MHGHATGTFDGAFESWRKLIHPDDWPAVELAIKHAQESGDVAAEYRVVYKDGSVHWLRAKGRMFFDTEGRPNRIVGFMLEVTDWRHAQEDTAGERGALPHVRRPRHGCFLSDGRAAERR